MQFKSGLLGVVFAPTCSTRHETQLTAKRVLRLRRLCELPLKSGFFFCHSCQLRSLLCVCVPTRFSVCTSWQMNQVEVRFYEMEHSRRAALNVYSCFRGICRHRKIFQPAMTACLNLTTQRSVGQKRTMSNPRCSPLLKLSLLANCFDLFSGVTRR